MAEISSGNVTVLVLNERESSKLGDVLGWVASYNSGPWGSLDDLFEVLDAYGITVRS